MDQLSSDIVKFLKDNNYIKSSGIIYCLTRDECEKLSVLLKTKHGIPAGFYHADMKDERRKFI